MGLASDTCVFVSTGECEGGGDKKLAERSAVRFTEPTPPKANTDCVDTTETFEI